MKREDINDFQKLVKYIKEHYDEIFECQNEFERRCSTTLTPEDVNNDIAFQLGEHKEFIKRLINALYKLDMEIVVMDCEVKYR